jgi:hypothetical protein
MISDGRISSSDLMFVHLYLLWKDKKLLSLLHNVISLNNIFSISVIKQESGVQ